MTLNHLNLVVPDVSRAILLFETHFGFTCVENKGRDSIAILRNSDDFVLVLMSSRLNKSENVSYPENFHIGFLQKDKESVIQIYEKLQTERLVFESEPRKIRDTFGFYFHFDNVMIEIGTYN